MERAEYLKLCQVKKEENTVDILSHTEEKKTRLKGRGKADRTNRSVGQKLQYKKGVE